MKVILFLVAAILVSCSTRQENQAAVSHSDLRYLTLISTNDIHGGVEPSKDKTGRAVGGLAMLGSIVRAHKEGLQKKHPNQSGVLVLDAGDQFQGTLISNYDEGELVFRAMNEVGYDGVVPGNHDFDFGPSGWLVDQSPDTSKRRESLEKLVKLANFPLLSANTFFKESIVGTDGQPLKVAGSYCRPPAGKKIDWSKATSPSFARAYQIKEIAGVRVALIGLDNPSTPNTTTAENVSDLCFGDEEEHYRRVRGSLEGKADVFILVIHNGNSNNEENATKLVKALTSEKPLVDAVISGHTHFTYKTEVNKIHITQSGSCGWAFGRIDLVWDSKNKKVVQENTKSFAGVKMYPDSCEPFAKDFCTYDSTTKELRYENQLVAPDSAIVELIKKARARIAPLAERQLAVADHDIKRDRINESELANTMTDVLRTMSSAQVAAINTGGIRNDISKGVMTYEDFFKVFPFANRAITIGPLDSKKLITILNRSIQTCGKWGALMQSGLKVSYYRDCTNALASGGIDPNAKLLKVETVDGQSIYEDGKGFIDENLKFSLATIDFIAAGGDGFEVLKGMSVLKDFGIMREGMSDFFTNHFQTENALYKLRGVIDSRWKNTYSGTPNHVH